jgi:organic hydroperoxide reductase OsmC/OhrA
MSVYTAIVTWERGGAAFVDNRFSRAHTWTFDGGVTVPASASPHVVRLPLSRADAVDPEEAFVASLSSCHMLTFLWVAATRGFVVDSYRDEPAGVLAQDADGHLAMTTVTLRPRVVFAGDRQPSTEELGVMHHAAHDGCFIARSVKTAVRVEAEAGRP